MPAPPRAAELATERTIEPADALPAALQRLETDIASVFLARLEGLFEPEALGLHDGPFGRFGPFGPLREDSFLSRIGKADFWTCALCKKDQDRYSPAVRFYLMHLFPDDAGMEFREACQVWGQSFFAARHDLESARDILLLFLDQNLGNLKRLYILDQAHNQDVAPNAQALQRCFDAPANVMLFVGGHFARWVLEDWLPFHLRHVCCRGFLAQEETLAQDCPRSAPGCASLLN